MTTNQPPTIEERLSRLETLFTNVGETVLAQNNAIAAMSANVNAQSATIDVLNDAIAAMSANVNAQNATIDVLVANIQQLTENVNAVTNRVDTLAIQAEQDRAQAAQDRQQAAIDRQAFQNEIQRIWQYLLQQGGNGRQGQG